MIQKHQQKNRYVIIGCAAISILAVTFYTLYCGRGFFNSDVASYLLLAKEQIAKKQFFPDGFCYSTGIFTFTSELFIVPLMLFIPDWLLCREIAVIILNMLVFIMVCILFRQPEKEKKLTAAPFVVLVLWCIPLGHYQQFLYEAAYVPLIFFELCTMFFLNRILYTENKKVYYALLFLVIYMANIGGISDLFIMVLPLAAAVVLYLLIENWKDLDHIFSHKKYNFIIMTIMVAAVCAYATYKYLANMVGLWSDSAGIGFVAAETAADNFRNLILEILKFYSAVGEVGLFSASGVTICLNFVVMLVSSVIVPVYMLVIYQKIESKFWKIYTIYCWFSNLLILYTMIFTTATTSRYYYPVFWHNVMLTGLLAGHLIEKSHKYISSFLVMSIIIVCIMGHNSYLRNTVQSLKTEYENDQVQGTIAEYLEDNDLTYGFATYWNAYNNMALSNGKVEIVAYSVQPYQPFFWLTSKDWYDPGTHPGRCFILLKEGEVIDERYYNLASDIRQFREYSILIFDKHIYLYDEFGLVK